jgi:CRP-like cAMP-binding protein
MSPSTPDTGPCGRANIVTFPRGEEILTHNALAEHVFLIVSGKVSLWRQGQWLDSLSSQSVLGLEGLFNRGGVYAYTAKAETLCRLVRYSMPGFLEELVRTPRLSEMTLASTVRQLDTGWTKLSRGHLAESESHFIGDIRICQPGDWVIREGEETTEIFRIISTELGLEVSKSGQVLAVLNEHGEIFGEMAAVLQERRSASVRSLGHSVLEVYPEQQLLEILSDHTDISLRIIRSLSRRLAQTSRTLAELKQTPADHPLAGPTPSAETSSAVK